MVTDSQTNTPTNRTDYNTLRHSFASVQYNKIWGIIQQQSLSHKSAGSEYLIQHLIDVWAGVEQSIIDDAIDQWHRRLHACIRATGHCK